MAPANISLVSSTEPVFHDPMGWLKDVAFLNIFAMDVAPLTSQDPMFWLNVVLASNRLSMLRFVPVKLHAEMGPLRTPQPEPEHWQSPSVFSVKHAVTAALSCDDVTVVAGGGDPCGVDGGVPPLPPLPPVAGGGGEGGGSGGGDGGGGEGGDGGAFGSGQPVGRTISYDQSPKKPCVWF